jgi:hypothetical protein
MHEYITALIYIILGLFSAYVHWYKKRYIDRTTNCSFFHYISDSFPATLWALGAILFAEVNLSFLQTTEWPSLRDIIAACGVGYGLDSGINRAADQETK